jgi:S1-C subfamily serine protease
MKQERQRLKLELQKAIEESDRTGITEASEKLITHIRSVNRPMPKQDAHEILNKLRGIRRFDLMQRVSDALIQSGQDSPQIRRQFAQSLLDQGNITAGIETLSKLTRQSKGKDSKEHIEAKGLLGRAYKQLYMDAPVKNGAWVKNALKESVKNYLGVYRDDKTQLWHGINAAALLKRAEADGLRFAKHPQGTELSNEIITAIERKKKPSTWDLATAVEANVGLERYDDALLWLHRYVSDKELTAFHLASLERQLREVWGMQPDTGPGMRVLPILRGELLRREGAQVEVSQSEIQAGSEHREDTETHLQKILGRTGVQTYRWWLTALARARCVARIGFGVDRGEGTGFLVRGKDLSDGFSDEVFLMTNAHVVSDEPGVNAIRPEDAVIWFETSTDEGDAYQVSDLVSTSPPGELDFTLLKLDRPVTCAEPFPVHPRLPARNKGRVYIIGHPQGGTLSFSFQDNVLIDHRAPLLHYRAPTEPGSSGSPIFNEQWKLIGIHHAGGESMRKLNGSGTYAANEGIWIESIREAL